MADNVNSPEWYRIGRTHLEVIDLTENLSHCRAAAVEYIVRAGKKDPATELEDLQKAAWYIRREIHRLNMQRSIPIPSIVSDLIGTMMSGPATYEEEVNQIPPVAEEDPTPTVAYGLAFPEPNPDVQVITNWFKNDPSVNQEEFGLAADS